MSGSRTLLAALALLTACSAAPDDLDAHPPVPSRAAPAPAHTATVTLITGDRVRVLDLPGRPPAYQVEPGPGRSHVTFTQVRSARGTSVIPGDAAPLLAAGRIDRRLFEVSALIAAGFDDQHMATLPLIVTRTGARARVAVAAATTARELPSIHGAALVADKRSTAELWRSVVDPARPRALAASTGVATIWLDGRAQLLLDRSMPQIGGAIAHQRGVTGRGVTVAILDTGIRLDHPDFRGRIAEARDFTGTLASGDDDQGHGTHCAGAIAGSGAASGGRYQGVAPEATLISGKVCTTGGCPESAIIAGMEWAAPRARVVSMSLGGGPTDGTDPLSLALNRLTAQHGTLFVVAAGNSGEAPDGRPLVQQVGAPAAADAALAVASVTKQDRMSSFSSRGPRVDDGAVKPDVAAPGSDIVSTRAPGTEAGDAQPVDDAYCTLSGTSMATPQVAGAAALLAQQHSDWTAPQLKAALMSTATRIADANVYDQGAGRVDLARATAQTVFADTPSISFHSRWPHSGAEQSRTVAFRNDGAAPVVLDLALTATDPAGQPAPDSMFAVATTRLTVPPRGRAETSVTWRPATGALGAYSGVLTATGGDARVVVAIGGYREPETYDLTLRAVDRDGRSPVTTMIGAVDVASNELREIAGLVDGRRTIRVPRGTYDVIAMIETAGAPGAAAASISMLARSAIAVDRDTEVTLDARAARPVTITVDRPGAVITQARVYLQSGEPVIAPLIGRDTAIFAEPASSPRLGFQVRAVLEAAGDAIEPYSYNLILGEAGGIPEQLAFRLRDDQLARVESRYFGQGMPLDGGRWDIPGLDLDTIWWRPQPLPARRTEYYTVLDGVSWAHILTMAPPSGALSERLSALVGVVPQYRAGTFRADWNRAPVGPAVGANLVHRNGDTLRASVALFATSEDGHATATQPTTDGIAGTLTLSRDGTAIATSNLAEVVAEVPAGPATYTLAASATRTVPWSALATRVDATWTFRSEHVENRVPTEPGVPVPLIVVRASGAVDDLGVAAGSAAYPLTLRVERQQGVPVAAITELALDVSYDDGARWQPATIERTADGGVATLAHPGGDGFVSLRSRARDAAGSSVEQTVIRAYPIRGRAAPPDAGVPPDAGASPDAGRPRPDPDDDGCGCRAGSGAPAQNLALAVLLVGLWLRRAMRRA